ncbi:MULTISPECIES: ABC transporter substrate-binding protein [Paenibacillus]|uniref:ABC transporter substrate-binding protein n=1 Tax=Paenibacillus campinasensis TaxID=66347 RepID=A0A268EV54_9BACL|nr:MULTISPECIES: extracellular solute-binding protein [Paenibacillus]MUG66877.1 extracellular solute-binding protein [Paenibacillus campinasensis]PAD76997.1 ABC transporter substrate-binding protein [Paenibacillus campinasensis]PAK55892.1 ABC transporter substrate-binding protein [Paenibacillus sp. 7541]
MRKYSMLLLSLMLLAAVLAACSGNGATEDNPGGEAAGPDDGSQSKITIKIHYPLPDQKEARAQEDDKIKRFTEMYPNVTIVKDDWQYNVNEIGIKMASNEAPTFYNTFATEAQMLVEHGWVADISELYNSWEYKDEMNSLLQSQFIVDGKVYGITQNGYVTSTVINKGLLDEKQIPLPDMDWTWDDMYNTAKGAADPKKGISGIAPMGKGNEAGWNWTNFLFEAGGEIQEIENGKYTAIFNSEAGVKALDFYKKLRWEANAIPQDWALGWSDAINAFQQGRTAMVIAGASDIIDSALNQGGLKPENVIAYPMPAYEKGGKHIGILGGNYLVINPNATKEEQEMAFRYITFDYFTDKGLEALEANIQERKSNGKYYVPAPLNYFSDDSEYAQKLNAIYDKYDNVYRYDERMLSLIDGKPEAQYGTQDYYGVMANVVQESFSKEGTDSKSQLDEAAKTVQTRFFDKIEAP